MTAAIGSSSRDFGANEPRAHDYYRRAGYQPFANCQRIIDCAKDVNSLDGISFWKFSCDSAGGNYQTFVANLIATHRDHLSADVETCRRFAQHEG
jgi:hypothetical protein